MRSKRLRIGVASAACLAAVLALTAALATGASRPTMKVGAGKASATKSVCGLGNGKKATGKPIVLGGIFTHNPGVDFSPIGLMAQAYWNCMNANGGVNGRPIVYKYYTESDEPDKVASLAVKLADSDHVVAIVGNTSDLDCIVNQKFYEKRGFRVIGAGVAAPCFTTPNFAMVNMGPHYSNTGAAQALVHAGAKSIVVYASNVPGARPYYDNGATAVARQAKLPHSDNYVDVPIQDANSLVLKIVQQAGPGGGADFALIPPEGLKVMLAAGSQGLIDKIHWSGATPFNSQFIADALGPEWNGKFLVNAEFNLLSSKGPDETLYVQLWNKYQKGCAACFGSFGQMGFLVGKTVGYTLLALKPSELTQKGVNAAFLKIKNFKSDMWCAPWYYGNLKSHNANLTDRTVVPNNHTFTQKEGCFKIANVDAQVAQAHADEKKFSLTSGSSWPPIPGQQ
jgi:branched-chain amino acid transport system substrate-binding protein